jgi:hypothetical protein
LIKIVAAVVNSGLKSVAFVSNEKALMIIGIGSGIVSSRLELSDTVALLVPLVVELLLHS